MVVHVGNDPELLPTLTNLGPQFAGQQVFSGGNAAFGRLSARFWNALGTSTSDA